MASRSDEIWKSTSLAGVYLEGIRGAIPLAHEQIDVMVRLVAASGIPIRRFLDIGCGDGILSDALLQRFPGAQAVLTDFSAAMLEAAARRFAGRHAKVTCIESDYGVPSWIQQIPANEPFDAVISGLSIHHQPDARKQELYAEIFRLLSPGGVFVNVEHVSSASPWVESLHDELFIDHLHVLHAAKPRNEVASTYFYRPDKAANILAPVEVQCEWLRRIGYRDVDCYLKIFELAVFGGRKPEV